MTNDAKSITNNDTFQEASTVDFSSYPIHVLASVLKQIFRELPEPLMTYDLYQDFLRAAEVQDDKSRVQLLFAIIKQVNRLSE